MKAMEKAKDFYENHRHEIIKVGGAIGAAALLALVIKTTGKKKPADNDVGSVFIKVDEGKYIYDLPKPRLSSGSVQECWHEKNGVNMIIDGLKLNDLGRLGKDISEAGINRSLDADVGLIVGISDTPIKC